jgi:hypothetical protein
MHREVFGHAESSNALAITYLTEFGAIGISPYSFQLCISIQLRPLADELSPVF